MTRQRLSRAKKLLPLALTARKARATLRHYSTRFSVNLTFGTAVFKRSKNRLSSLCSIQRRWGMKDEVALIKRLNSIDEYRLRFRRIFPRTGITLETVAKAIAAYERTLLSDDAPFDRFIAGDSSAISEDQRRGWELFRGKAKCIECHAFSTASPLFTDSKFYNTGIATRSQDLEDSRKLAEKIRLSRRGDKLDSSLLACPSAGVLRPGPVPGYKRAQRYWRFQNANTPRRRVNRTIHA